MLSDFCLSAHFANSVWVTEHCKMPKLERAFKWREIEYARLTLTDLANVKQLSEAKRATIIIGGAHFQVAVEREDLFLNKMFHPLSLFLSSPWFWRFLHFCFYIDRCNLNISNPWIIWLRKKSEQSLDNSQGKNKYICTTTFLVYLSCHWVVRVQWCWQLIHVQMSPLPGWQSEYIKLIFPSARMTGCSESRQQSCHKQLSALTIIRFIYWRWSGRTAS